MKTRSTNSSNAITARGGLEPVILLIVNWGGFATTYATKDITVNGLSYSGKILDWSGIQMQQRSESSADTGDVSFTLDDYDGATSARLTSAGSETVTVTASVYYDGISGTAPTEVFRGTIANPIDGNQADGTLSLTCVVDIQSNEVGYVLTEDQDLSNRNDTALGKSWPLVFGKAAHVPALLAQRAPTTSLAQDIQMGHFKDVPDLWKDALKNFDGVDYADIEIINNNSFFSKKVTEEDLEGVQYSQEIFDVEDSTDFPHDEIIDIIVDGVVFRGLFATGSNTFHGEANVPKYENLALQDSELTTNQDYTIITLDPNNVVNLVGHVIIFNAAQNPTLLHYTNQEEHTRTIVRQEGNICWMDKPLPFATPSITPYHLATSANVISKVYGVSPSGLKVSIKDGIEKIKSILKGKARRKANSGMKNFGSIIKKLELLKYIKNAYWSAEIDDTVRLWSQDTNANDDVYIANSVESDAVTGVYGLRKHPETGKEVFTQVPSYFYAKDLSEATNITNGPTTVTTIRFSEPLSEFKGQGWKDQIYVTVDSTLSDNTATAMKYILDTYTNLTTDTSTFASVATDLQYFPSNFALLKPWDAINLVNSMAWQCRCALVYSSDEVKIRYLPVRPSNWAAGTGDYTAELGSLKSVAQESESIVTRLQADWRESYRPASQSVRAEDLNKKKIYENNIAEFGLIEEATEIFIYNVESLVQKTTDFWGLRRSKVWMQWDAVMFHPFDVAEAFDGITLDTTSHDPPFPFTGTVAGDIIACNLALLEGANSVRVQTNIAQGDITATSGYYVTDTESSSPTNPADSISEGNGAIFKHDVQITIDEVIKKLQNVKKKVKVRGYIVSSGVSGYEDRHTVDLHGNGLHKPATEKGVVAHNTDPNKDYSDGDVCEGTLDDDGDIYIDSLRENLRVEVISQDADTVTVRAVPPDATQAEDDATNDFEISKPFDLQRNQFEGNLEVTDDGELVLHEYTANDARSLTNQDTGDTEDQIIIPPYVIRQTVNSVTYRGSLLEVGFGSHDGMIDLNHIGRKWGKV